MTENSELLSEKTDLTVLSGNEKKLNYTILPIPSGKGRFAFTWDVFTSRLGRLIYVNLLMLLCFSPLIVIFLLRMNNIIGWGALGSFGDNLGVGYPASPDTVGMAESLMIQADTVFFALAMLMSFFTAAGIAGGMYCVRKLIRSDDKFHIVKDFLTGVKKGYFSALIACALSFVMIFVCVLVWDYAAYETVTGGNAALYIFFRVLVCVALAAVILFSLWLVSIGSNYKQNAWGLIKNSASIGAGTILQSVFFAVFAALPALLFLFSVDILNMLAEIYFILLGFSVALLIWCSFADWAFDGFADYTAMQTNSQKEARNKAVSDTEKEEDVMSLLLVEGKNGYLSRAIQSVDEGTEVYTLPDSFTAEDLHRLAENKEKIREESLAFAAAHAEEKRYKEYNARFADREKALTDAGKKGKKKKFAPKMLNQ